MVVLGPGFLSSNEKLLKEGLASARDFIGRYGNTGQRSRDAMEEGPKFISYL